MTFKISKNFFLKIYHNFKSYQNMLTFKSSFLYYKHISNNFSLNNIYIASHLHVVKES
jgi:hypothetical protein